MTEPREGVSGEGWRLEVSQADRPPETGDDIQVLFFRGYCLNPSPAGNAPASASVGLRDLYSRYGVAMGRHVTGDVSFVLWDRDCSRLVLCADRLGLHPLFFSFQRGCLVVSPEVELCLNRLPERSIDRTSLVAHLAGFFLPPGTTFYNQVQRLEAGTMGVLEGGRFRTERYWDPQENRPCAIESDVESIATLRELFETVIEDWLRVLPEPTGLTISAGMDSPGVASVLRSMFPRLDIRAFAWVHPTLPRADESEGIRHVSRYLRLDLTEIKADSHWTLSSPLGLRSPVSGPEVHHYREAWESTLDPASKAGHVFLLSGVGGDELFGSISCYPDLLRTGRWGELGSQLARHRKELGLGLRTGLRLTLDPLLRSCLPGWEQRRFKSPVWLTREALEVTRSFWHPPLRARAGDLGRTMRARWLQNFGRSAQPPLLSRLARSYGISMVHPFLDHRLVDFACTLPSEATYAAGRDKVILRKMMSGLLPSSLLTRLRKTTVEDLFHRGFREKESARVWPLLKKMRCAELGLLDESALGRAYQGYLSGEADGFAIWRAAVAEDWLRRYF